MKLKKFTSIFLSMTLLFTGVSAMAVKADSLPKIYVVGDSTACEYEYDNNYALPRAGWGMYLDEYVNDKVEVVDLAMSGRSSKSFATEDNYKTLVSDVKAGDFVLIQFGHNDAKKSSDEDLQNRYTDPEGDKDTEGSFKNSLYENYVKPALDAGATPILLTPISRHSFDEDGNVKDTHGLYDDAIRELAAELDLNCVDMTQATTDLYNEMGDEGSLVFHAVFRDTAKGTDGYDTTHLNHYGAAVIARSVAYNLEDFDSIKSYIDDEKVEDDSLYCVDGMTRGEFVSTLVRILGKDAQLNDDGKYELLSSKDAFADVDTEATYATAVCIAKEIGLSNGDENGDFNGDEALTMQDMCVLVERAFNIGGKSLKTNTLVRDVDVQNVSDYATDAVNGVINAFYDSGSTFDGKEPADRVTCFYLYGVLYDNLYEQKEDVQAQSIDQLEVVEKYDKK